PQASGLLRLVAREDAAPGLEDREPRLAGRNAPDAGRPAAPHEGVVLALPERRTLDEDDLAKRREQVLHDRVAFEERRHALARPGDGALVVDAAAVEEAVHRALIEVAQRDDSRHRDLHECVL